MYYHEYFDTGSSSWDVRAAANVYDVKIDVIYHHYKNCIPTNMSEDERRLSQ